RYAVGHLLKDVVQQPQQRTHAEPGVDRFLIDERDKGSEHSKETNVSRGVILDVLPHVPPTKRLRREGQLRRLACEDRIFGLRLPRQIPGGSPDLVFGTRRRPVRRRPDAVSWRRTERIKSLQPRFLPEHQASGLTASVSFSTASNALQVDGPEHLP